MFWLILLLTKKTNLNLSDIKWQKTKQNKKQLFVEDEDQLGRCIPVS